MFLFNNCNKLISKYKMKRKKKYKIKPGSQLPPHGGSLSLPFDPPEGYDVFVTS